MSANEELTVESADTLSDQRLTQLFEETKTVAVVGASTQDHKAAHRIPLYLQRRGFTVLPVNPTASGQELFGETVSPSLVELGVGIDIVNVFRRSDDVPGHLDDILALHPKPKAVWLQLGIRNDAVARQLRAAGIAVVQDRCIKVEHARLFGQITG